MFVRVASMSLTRFTGLCIRHRLALLIAFTLAVVVVAPEFIFMHTPAYRGIEMTGTDAEEYYVARIQEVYDGNPSLGNVFLPQKDVPYLIPGLGENMVARLGQILGQRATLITVIGKFIFPFLITLLVYALIYTLSASVPGAVLASTLVVAGDALYGGPSTFIGVLMGRAPIEGFLLSARPINPEVSALFLFAALFILARYFFRNRRPTWFSVVMLGLLAGGALYVSPFISTFLFAIFGFFLLWFFFKKEYVCVKAIIASIVVGLIAVVPFLLNLLRLQQNPYHVEASIRQGLIHTHTPIVGLWLIVLIVSLFIWPRRYSAARPFFAVSIIALTVLMNQQVLTGFAVQPAHYHWYLTKPLAGMVLALFAVFLTERLFTFTLLRRVVYSLCFVILFASAALIQRDSYSAHYTEAVESQAYAPVFSFLQTLPLGQSVWADRTLSLYIPMYTKQDVPNHSFVEYDPIPLSFLEKRLMLEYALRNVPASEARATMREEREDISSRLYGVYWRDQHGSYAAIPDALLEQYANDYRKSLHQTISEKLHELGVTVLVWDTANSPSWDIDHALGISPIFTTARFKIYQIATSTNTVVR